MLYFLRVHVAWREGSKVGVETPLSLLSFCDGTRGHHPPPPPFSKAYLPLIDPKEEEEERLIPAEGEVTPAEENVWLGSLGVAKRRKVFSLIFRMCLFSYARWEY